MKKKETIQTDKGKEFYNATVQAWLKREGIHHFSTKGDAKAAVVERFNRTLKGRMYRYFTAANTLKYIDILPDLVAGYNASKHRSIGLAPRKVTPENEEFVWQRLYGLRLKPDRRRPRLARGDRVRLSKRTRLFKKGYLPQWTEEVFVVQRVVPGVPITYKIEEMDGTPVEGTFYEEDLQKVTVEGDTLWRIEKVLKSQCLQIWTKQRHKSKNRFCSFLAHRLALARKQTEHSWFLLMQFFLEEICEKTISP